VRTQTTAEDINQWSVRTQTTAEDINQWSVRTQTTAEGINQWSVRTQTMGYGTWIRVLVVCEATNHGGQSVQPDLMQVIHLMGFL
jgi:hypothetical protein